MKFTLELTQRETVIRLLKCAQQIPSLAYLTCNTQPHSHRVLHPSPGIAEMDSSVLCVDFLQSELGFFFRERYLLPFRPLD